MVIIAVVKRIFGMNGADGADALMADALMMGLHGDLQKLWDSGIGLSAWLVRLAAAAVVVEQDAPASMASRQQQQQPAIVRELKEKLFGREECRIIELGPGLDLELGRAPFSAGGAPPVSSICDATD